MSADAPSFTPETETQPFDRLLTTFTPIVKGSHALVTIKDLFRSLEKVSALGLKFRHFVDSKALTLVYGPILSSLKVKAFGKLQIAIESPVDSVAGNLNIYTYLSKVQE